VLPVGVFACGTIVTSFAFTSLAEKTSDFPPVSAANGIANTTKATTNVSFMIVSPF